MNTELNAEQIARALRCNGNCSVCNFNSDCAYQRDDFDIKLKFESSMLIESQQAELKSFRDAAAEYGIDAKTMLTLAKSQIKTARENASMTAQLSELRLDPIRLCANVGDFTITGADFEEETITLQKTERFERNWAELHPPQKKQTV